MAEQSGGMAQGSDEMPKEVNQEEDMDDEDVTGNDVDDMVVAVNGGAVKGKHSTGQDQMGWRTAGDARAA